MISNRWLLLGVAITLVVILTLVLTSFSAGPRANAPPAENDLSRLRAALSGLGIGVSLHSASGVMTDALYPLKKGVTR